MADHQARELVAVNEHYLRKVGEQGSLKRSVNNGSRPTDGHEPRTVSVESLIATRIKRPTHSISLLRIHSRPLPPLCL
jgi:hypothetical protein